MGSTRLCSLAKYTVLHFSVVVTLYFSYLLTEFYSLPLMSSNGVRLFSWPCRPWNYGTVVLLFLQPYCSFWCYYSYILFLHSKLLNITLVWKIYNNIKINSLMSWSCALNLISGNFDNVDRIPRAQLTTFFDTVFSSFPSPTQVVWDYSIRY